MFVKLRKWWFIVGLLSMVTLKLAATPLTTPDASKVLTFAADQWCPFNCAPGAENEGFIVDIVRAVYEPLGYRVVYLRYPWARAILQAKRGKLTGILSAPMGSDVRDFIFHKEPVAMMRNALFKRKDSTFKFTGVASLDKVSIGFVHGYVFPGEIGSYLAKRAAAKAPNIQLVTSDDASEANIAKLAVKRVDLIAEDTSVVEYETGLRGYTNVFEIVTPIGSAEPIYVAFAPGNAGSKKLAQEIDVGMAKLRSSGKLSKILAKYHLVDWKK